MIVGIDGSRAFMKNRTGIEEYSYRVIKNLRKSFRNEKVFLYVRKTDDLLLIIDKENTKINGLDLPENWEVRIIAWSRFWTQIGLSLEMFLHPVDVLFVPAHTVPVIHPKKTIVTIHGLEYEFCPKAYSFWDSVYMRFSIKNSCSWASRIISVSENTKKDLMNLYNVQEDKIEVIYEGCGYEPERQTSNVKSQKLEPYLLFIGRLEERKNISNIIKAFEILKEKYKIPHKLILAGKSGFGYQEVKCRMLKVKCIKDILELGFVNEEEKWELLKNAEVFVFPTQYEGFGIPILEAQGVGCPVVASNNSSIPEIVEDSAILVDPKNPETIAEGINILISNENMKDAIIAKGLENVKRFSWEKCAKEVANLITV